jgi:hypothetical protein
VNSTNAIEKALQQKISAECREIVDKFIVDLRKLSDKYGGCRSMTLRNLKTVMAHMILW